MTYSAAFAAKNCANCTLHRLTSLTCLPTHGLPPTRTFTVVVLAEAKLVGLTGAALVTHVATVAGQVPLVHVVIFVMWGGETGKIFRRDNGEGGVQLEQDNVIASKVTVLAASQVAVPVANGIFDGGSIVALFEVSLNL